MGMMQRPVWTGRWGWRKGVEDAEVRVDEGCVVGDEEQIPNLTAQVDISQ